MEVKKIKSLKSYIKKIEDCGKLFKLKRKLNIKEVTKLMDLYGTKEVKNFYMLGVIDMPNKVLQYVLDEEEL